MIRFAKEPDIDRIMAFIDQYWRKGHILSTNRDFFVYEHLLEEGVGYVISEDDEGAINAILGYIPYGKQHRDVMMVMWKANHTASPTLGLELYDYLKQNVDARSLSAPGSNKKLKGLHIYLGNRFGKMSHWYKLNPAVSDFRIAKVSDSAVLLSKACSNDYVKLESWEQLERSFDFEAYHAADPHPYKEPWYLKKRYFDHPIYTYDVYGLKDTQGIVKTLFVFRTVSIEQASALRWVDCIGDFSRIPAAGTMMDAILSASGAEYVDCYESGLPDAYFEAGGWRKVEGSNNVIPNYFAPFVQENIDIYYFSTDHDMVLFKGDGDQDRPN